MSDTNEPKQGGALPSVPLQPVVGSPHSDTPRTDRKTAGVANNLPCEQYWIDFARMLERELSAANERVGQHLAACSCAAIMDTPESHAKAKIEHDNPFWSPAYEDVMRRTAECIRLREVVSDLVAHTEVGETKDFTYPRWVWEKAQACTSNPSRQPPAPGRG